MKIKILAISGLGKNYTNGVRLSLHPVTQSNAEIIVEACEELDITDNKDRKIEAIDFDPMPPHEFLYHLLIREGYPRPAVSIQELEVPEP